MGAVTALVPRRVREFVGHALAQLTDGQRYTAALALVLAGAFVAFGMPPRSMVPMAGTRGNPESARIPVAVAPAERPSPVVPPGADRFSTSSAERTNAAGPATIHAAPLEDGPVDRPTPSAAPGVVAVVRSGANALPGHDDAAIARAMLAGEGLAFTTVSYQANDASLCQRVLAAGRIVVAGDGLDGALRECLATGGSLTIAYDELGERRGTSGAVLSTRRAAGQALVDLARWGVRSRALSGRVGLVVPTDLRVSVEPVLPELRAAGVDVAAVTYLESGSSAPAQIADGVRSFAAAGIATVVFAVGVPQQRQWLALELVVGRPSRHIVSDLAGSVIDESYPPLFDGALAHVAVRVPWFARTHGETMEQTACLSRWAQVAGAGAPFDERERAMVLMWCQHARIAALATRVGGPVVDVAAAVRSQRVPSPLTSTLGQLADGTWGPTEDAVLVWRASCQCWREMRPFTPREELHR